MMKILITGSWQKQKAAMCKEEAEKIGELLAKKGLALMSGGGTGVSEIVVNSYKAHKGKKYVCYIPSIKEMRKVGERIGPKPDKLIETKLDYPERNILMVKQCDGIIALNGGLGTLTEIIHGIKDYDKKVAVIRFGELASWVKSIPELKRKVLVTKDYNKAIRYVSKK